MNLTIDRGNTCTKLILFHDAAPVYRKVVKELSAQTLERILKKFPVDNCLLSSVIPAKKSLYLPLKGIKNFRQLTSRTPLPIKNRYRTPQTLGNDRLANAVAGSFLFPEKNVLVIDAGTCIKYDFVNAKGEYLGGSISPGMKMRFLAMHRFTGKLPLARYDKLKTLTGRNTTESLQTGVVLGIAEEINGIIGRYRRKHKSLKVILTGGDSARFAGELKLSIFAAPDLVNLGLNEIIRYNLAGK